MANANDIIAKKNCGTLVRLPSSSCGNFNHPNKYTPNNPKMTIHNDKNTSLSRMCQLYARSATDRNFKAKANSMNPNVTLTTFIHPPDFGADFSNDGNKANNVNGMASAMAKPNIPMVGATMLPCVETATSKNPIIGPVHEKDTNANVKAIKKMESKPVVFSDFWSILFDHDEGSVISNAPKNEAANTTNNKQKKILNTALVANAFKALAPKSNVTANPNNT